MCRKMSSKTTQNRERKIRRVSSRVYRDATFLTMRFLFPQLCVAVLIYFQWLFLRLATSLINKLLFFDHFFVNLNFLFLKARAPDIFLCTYLG